MSKEDKQERKRQKAEKKAEQQPTRVRHPKKFQGTHKRKTPLGTVNPIPYGW